MTRLNNQQLPCATENYGHFALCKLCGLIRVRPVTGLNAVGGGFIADSDDEVQPSAVLRQGWVQQRARTYTAL